jgi:hypothetical protein
MLLQAAEGIRMQAEAVQNRLVLGEWQAEVVNYHGDGEVYVTIFSGPDAEVRAKEFCFQLIRGTNALHSDSQEFFANSSIYDLARIQNVASLEDPAVLSGGIPDDEDVRAFLQEIYDARK